MAEANLAVRYPSFQPAMRQIAAVTNANPAVVTTTFAHNYKTGTIIRLDITHGHGMAQANQQFGPIMILSPTSFTIGIDTTQYDTFFIPSPLPPRYTPSQTLAIAEIASILTAAEQNVLPHNVLP